MKTQSLLFLTLTIFFALPLQAQIALPNGSTTPLTHSSPFTNLMVNTLTDLTTTSSAAPHRVQVAINGGTIDYGARQGVFAITRSNGTTGQSSGFTRASLASASDWFLDGSLIGVVGLVDSVTTIQNTGNSGGSNAIGGSFLARISNPIPASASNTGTYTIAGSRSILDGNISTYPQNGLVAAMVAEDRIQGSQTWAGQFLGRVQVTDQVGIACTNMSQPTGGSGNVTYRLFVNGGIAGKELIIQNGGNWCDYVFEKDYDLMPLKEVERYIQETGHLPQTPSAAQIEANGGFEVGATTLNQQEKIEEIFLHLIALEKQVDQLKSENEDLKAQIKDLKQ
ncbi:MAG: bZIP transcription factor [Bacteroidetes bacterium]|nr:MAG: bZIP transcription factor [Bacteroidota bacterium]